MEDVMVGSAAQMVGDGDELPNRSRLHAEASLQFRARPCCV